MIWNKIKGNMKRRPYKRKYSDIELDEDSSNSHALSFINNSDYDVDKIKETNTSNARLVQSPLALLPEEETSVASLDHMKSLNGTGKNQHVGPPPSLLDASEESEETAKRNGTMDSHERERRDILGSSQLVKDLEHDNSLIPIQTSPIKSRSLETPKNASETRLVIAKLVLTNFKSYAGEQTIGPFHPSFSAIVGPNGSGKSNVIDSLLFVFGFRALKMRQGRLSELIHNSSEGQKLDFCQVDIHFHRVIDGLNGDLSEIVPNSELKVSRKAFKNNSSQYFINGKNSNYTEVTSFLRGQGIDLDHKRFLILQGEVESIAQMKAKAERENDDGLLEYLEDIIGTTKYKQLIEDSSIKVAELNEVCVEREKRLNLVEQDKNMLEERKTEALKFLELEKTLIFNKSLKFRLRIANNEINLDSAKQKLNELEDKLEKERKENEIINNEIKDSETKYLQISKDIKIKTDQLSRVTKNLKAIKSKRVIIKEKQKNMTTRRSKALQTMEELKRMINRAKNDLNNGAKSLDEYKEEQEELSKSLEIEKATLQEIRGRLASKTAPLTQEMNKLQEQLEPWNDQVKEKENEVRMIVAAVEILRKRREEISKALEENKLRISKIKSEGRQKESDLEVTEIKLENILNQIEIGERQCASERRDLEIEKSAVDSFRQSVQEAITSISQLNNKNKVLSSLMKLANSGRIEGFYGRLGDLGTIDDQYDIAVSTAAPGLDSMVVDSVETAQQCIHYLRKNNIGFANFICLDKLRKFNMSPISIPGNPASVKRLFDLISCDNPKFLPAFYSKLFDTLVASNLSEAKTVAYGPKRFRVVTLDGKLVDTSGTMSGGGKSVARNGMRLRSANASRVAPLVGMNIEKQQKELSDLESKLEMSKVKFQENLLKLRSLKEMKPDLELTISKLKLDIESLGSEKKELQNEIRKLMECKEADKDEAKVKTQIEEKERNIEQLNMDKEKLKLQMVPLENKIKTIEDKVMEISGVELKIQSSKVSSISLKLEILDAKQSKERINTKKLEKDIKKYEAQFQGAQDEYEGADKESQAISEQEKLLLVDIDAFEKEVEKHKEDISEFESLLEDIRLDLESRRKNNNRFKSIEIEIENNIENIKSKIKGLTKFILDDSAEINSLSFRDVKSYIDWLDEETQKRYNVSTLENITHEDLNNINMDEINEQIEELENYMSSVKVDIEVLKEYGDKKSEFEMRFTDFNAMIKERDEVKRTCEELKKKRLDEFMEGFNTISTSLKEMYQMITMGGNAELELVDSLDPFSEGILFSVMPPKKSWKNISNLSGGEKTLSSLALVFALHKYKPTPLYVMDEIDAALDFRNVSIVANYIKERTKNAQFVVISLRNNMFELSKQLVGIYKINNMTKSISIQNKDFLHDDEERI